MPFIETQERFRLDRRADYNQAQSSHSAQEFLASWETSYSLLEPIWQAAVDALPFVDLPTLQHRFLIASINLCGAIEKDEFEGFFTTEEVSTLDEVEALLTEQIMPYQSVPGVEAILKLGKQLKNAKKNPMTLDDAFAAAFPPKYEGHSSAYVPECFDQLNDIFDIGTALVVEEDVDTGIADLHIPYVSADPTVQTQLVLQGFNELSQEDIAGVTFRGISCLISPRLAPIIKRVITKKLNVPEEAVFMKSGIRIPDILSGEESLPYASTVEGILVSYANIKFAREHLPTYFLTGEPPPVGILYFTVPEVDDPAIITGNYGRDATDTEF